MGGRRTQSTLSTFAKETELREPVAAWVRVSWPDAVLADEVGPRYARADLVAGLGGPLSARAASGPLAEASYFALLDFLSEPKQSSDLKAWRPSRWREFSLDVLPALSEQGAVRYDEESDYWWAEAEVSPPFEQLLSIELKLRDATKALAQASLHRLFANQAFVAMPSSRIGDSLLAEAVRLGVGVLAVAPDGETDCLVSPLVSDPSDQAEWRLSSEIVLADYLDMRAGNFLAGSPGTPRGRTPVPA